MADFNELIPFILYWETSAVPVPGEPNESLFERARKRGYANDPADSGGHTMCGVTLSTYSAWRKRLGILSTGVSDLKKMPYGDWKSIMKNMFWDRWKADEIESQPVANILADWVWHSGVNGIKIPQKLLKVRADGLVGPETIRAVNSQDPRTLFERLREARLEFVNSIAARKASQKKFLKGWIRRINSITWDGLATG